MSRGLLAEFAIALLIAIGIVAAVRVAVAGGANSFPAISQLAGGGDVRCATPAEWATDPIPGRLGGDVRAYTTIAAPRHTVLRPDVCGALVVLILDPNDGGGSALNGGPGYRTQEAYALLTILHEAVHLAGELDEGQADCQGVRGLEAAAQRLGATAAAARDLYQRAYAYHLSKPAAYRTVC